MDFRGGGIKYVNALGKFVLSYTYVIKWYYGSKSQAFCRNIYLKLDNQKRVLHFFLVMLVSRVDSVALQPIGRHVSYENIFWPYSEAQNGIVVKYFL